MSKQKIKKRVEKLRAEIDRFRYEYHVLDKPDISDEVHDFLILDICQLSNIIEMKA